jgi:predicted acyltransferase
LAGKLSRILAVGRTDSRWDLKLPDIRGRGGSVKRSDRGPRPEPAGQFHSWEAIADMGSDQVLTRRIVSLDQFRGYTVVGMLLVNFLGGFQVVPAILKHHNTYVSYADTIMPQFFFAVGFAYRLTFLRRLAEAGVRVASRAVLKRNLGLILLGFVLYHLDGSVKSWAELLELGFQGFLAQAFRRELFQTLVHIAIASIWVLPVIAAGATARVVFLLASAALHLWLSSRFYFDWAWKTPVIDGGQLGFLTWTIPMLVGSLAHDAILRPGAAANPAPRLLAWSGFLMVAGYAISCLGGHLAAPPFLAPSSSQAVGVWTMSQRAGSVSYLTFAAGFSLAVYALCLILCDQWGAQAGVFRVFGRNALAAYVIHPLVAGAVKPYVPNDAPFWYVSAGLALYLGICTLFNDYLEKHKIFLRL